MLTNNSNRLRRSRIEMLEGRLTPSASPHAALAASALLADRPSIDADLRAGADIAAQLPAISAATRLDDSIGLHLGGLQAEESLGAVTGISVQNVAQVNGQLMANATITGNLAGESFQIPAQIPLSLSGTLDPTGTGNVLQISLGPTNLNLLGLEVGLNDGSGGPIVLNVAGGANAGTTLGSAVDQAAGLLRQGTAIPSGLLSQLTGSGGDLSQILNGVFSQLPTTGLDAGGSQSIALHPNGNGIGSNGSEGNGSPRTSDIISLDVGATQLNVLGLNVSTSGINLDVTAMRGEGGLLGNLFSSAEHLLSNPAAPLDAVFAQIGQADRALDRLFLV